MNKEVNLKSEALHSVEEGSEVQADVPAEKSADELRRDFLRRFGGYAASAPAAVYMLMSPRTSRAVGSDGAPY